MSESVAQQDTIAAIATGMTQAGIGIVRISGAEATTVAERVFRPRSGQPITDFTSHTMHLGNIVDPQSKTGTKQENLTLDEALLSVMRAPHSYTGEDVVEINCHGGIYLCQRVLELVLRCGARLAEPGEFTKRAFLNGRMDLSQAEAVMDLISAKNAFALRNGVRQLGGGVREKITALREDILHEIAYIEAALDDPEHYDLTDYPEELDGKVSAFLDEIEHLLALSQNGRIRKDGIRTAILGKPNVGKSSILNLLSGRETAIVTEIAGTTRDTIEESVRLGDLQLNLVDTAGIRDAEDAVEQIGVERARAAANDADLILFVIDASAPLDENDREIANTVAGKNTIILYNKSDLAASITEDELHQLFEGQKALPEIIRFSAKTGDGVEGLRGNIEEIFHAPSTALNDEVIITNLRQIQELQLARRSLYHVLTAIETFMTEDFFSIDLTDAYRHLGYIIGEEIGDDVTDKIFSEFCMGK